jgi:membrane-associated phospholipid phosphatase
MYERGWEAIPFSFNRIGMHMTCWEKSAGKYGSPIAALFLSTLVTISPACGTMSNGRGWGEDATFAPGWGRFVEAALSAASAPETWAPAAAAVAFRVSGNADRNLAEWAAKSTPLFGSQRNAEQMSDNLASAAGAIWAASAIATPSGDTPADWIVNKTRGIGVQAGGGIFMRQTVGYLKNAVDRTQPNGLDQDGFPSGHVTGAAFFSTLASRNMETLGWSRDAAAGARIGLGTVTAATAWARVEANQHYPSDVLGSIALGHFLGVFLTDAFLGIDNARNVLVLFEPSGRAALATVRFDF